MSSRRCSAANPAHRRARRSSSAGRSNSSASPAGCPQNMAYMAAFGRQSSSVEAGTAGLASRARASAAAVRVQRGVADELGLEPRDRPRERRRRRARARGGRGPARRSNWPAIPRARPPRSAIVDPLARSRRQLHRLVQQPARVGLHVRGERQPEPEAHVGGDRRLQRRLRQRPAQERRGALGRSAPVSRARRPHAARRPSRDRPRDRYAAGAARRARGPRPRRRAWSPPGHATDPAPRPRGSRAARRRRADARARARAHPRAAPRRVARRPAARRPRASRRASRAACRRGAPRPSTASEHASVRRTFGQPGELALHGAGDLLRTRTRSARRRLRRSVRCARNPGDGPARRAGTGCPR